MSTAELIMPRLTGGICASYALCGVVIEARSYRLSGVVVLPLRPQPSFGDQRSTGCAGDLATDEPGHHGLRAAGITRSVPHPNAAKLFIDFLLSEEGQSLYRDADYISVHPNVPPRDPSLRPDGTTLKALIVRSDDVESTIAGWWKIYQEVFR